MHMTRKTRNTMKPPTQSQSPPVSSLVFEGVYSNARMLHFLTAVVGSTCDVRVKNGSVYEGIFKTLSSQCELAVDAVHRRSDGDEGGGDEGGGGGGGVQSSPLPRIEDITDTMIFSPTDLVTMTCRDVDLSFAVRDTFTDSAISASRLNGEHREKVLQRWDADADGDGDGDNFDLESDTSNGWDASEMFKFNEETYGVKTTYDSSLSTYTMPLERGSSESYRQREARAARLAGEIESGVQYRRRISLENEEERSEEDRFSSVVREKEERTSPAPSRDGRFVPRSGGGVRGGASGRTMATTSSTSTRLPPPGSSSVRTAGQSQSSSPPCTNHVLPHSLSHPQALGDGGRSPLNGVVLRTSPKSQRVQRNVRTTTTTTTTHSQSSPAVSRALKPDAPPQDLPVILDSSSSSSSSSSSTVTTATASTSSPVPTFPVDVNEILSSAAKERVDSLSQDVKSSKAPSQQQRSQLEELRKFGKEFRLQPSSSPSASSDPPPSSSSSSSSSSSPGLPKPAPPSLPSSSSSSSSSSSTQDAQQQQSTSEAPPTNSITSSAAAPTSTPGGGGGEERTEVAAAQVKNSTLNPNAKEFLPVKGNAPLKPASTPTPPRPAPPSPSVALAPPGQQGGGGAIYSSPPGHYLSYVSQIPLQAPQMFQYAMSSMSSMSSMSNQGKYPRPKGPVVGPRPEHHPSSPSPILQAPVSAAGPLVAPQFPMSYLQYGQVIQAMAPHYHGQTVYSMLQGGARMLGAGAPPQPMGPQYPGQGDGPPGPQAAAAMYAPQSFSHHSGSLHHPQPSSTPTGNQPPPQHTAPSPGHSQAGPAGPQPQSMFHSAGLSAATPPNLPPGHSSPQASYAMQGYGLPPPHQPLPHGFPSIGQLTQAHVAGAMSGPHHSAGHGHAAPVMLHYAAAQQGAAVPNPQHGPPPGQQGAPQHFYIGPAQAVQVQAHQQLSFHPSAN